MANYNYIPISQEELPVEKEIDLGDNTYKMLFSYNDRGDFYTVEIRSLEDELLLISKLVYGRDALKPLIDGLPDDIKVVPLNLFDIGTSEPVTETQVIKEYFSQQVKVYVFDE